MPWRKLGTFLALVRCIRNEVLLWSCSCISFHSSCDMLSISMFCLELQMLFSCKLKLRNDEIEGQRLFSTFLLYQMSKTVIGKSHSKLLRIVDFDVAADGTFQQFDNFCLCVLLPFWPSSFYRPQKCLFDALNVWITHLLWNSTLSVWNLTFALFKYSPTLVPTQKNLQSLGDTKHYTTFCYCQVVSIFLYFFWLLLTFAIYNLPAILYKTNSIFLHNSKGPSFFAFVVGLRQYFYQLNYWLRNKRGIKLFV